MTQIPALDDRQSFPPFTLSGSQVRRVTAAGSGIGYLVAVWLPPVPPPADGFPAVYVLDGHTLFGTFVEAVRRASRRAAATGVGPAVIVGIAPDHPPGELDTAVADARYRDFTFGPAASASNAAGGAVGGASRFLSFLVDELIPSLTHEMPLDFSRQMLFGHSLAGYFVLHALASRPGAFRSYAAISPSIWWDQAGLRTPIAGLARGSARVFIAVGEWEGDVLPPGLRDRADQAGIQQRRTDRRMIANARVVADDLRVTIGESAVTLRVFPEEDHASVLMIATQRALRFALGSDPA